MARYIDAEKAVEEARISYCKDCNSYNGVRCSACAFDDAMSYNTFFNLILAEI